jgi:arylsulfatase A-like enzyme
VKENLEGDDSKIIMDRALDFISSNSTSENPFFAVIWLHTPHLPVVASNKYREQYKELGFKEQTYFGTITAMDEQIGRLWDTLENLGESDNTMLWFCSDNGPENGTPGSSGGFRERKRSLYEGGVRVPAFCVWDSNIAPNQTLDYPMMTSDYFPTILDLLDIDHKLSRPMDGTSVKEAIAGTVKEREKPMGFLFRDKSSWVTHQYKLISIDKGNTYELYDLLNDPREQNDISTGNQDIVDEMKSDLLKWTSSVNDSRTGGDY